MEYTYQDCQGITRPLDKWHMHELVDRLYCVQTMIEELLVNHPANLLCKDEITEAQEILNRAYQNMGSIAYYMKDDK